MEYAERLERVRELINDHCIARVPRGSKELPALGGRGYYSWQFYLRRAVLDPDCLHVVCHDFWTKFEERFRATPFQLAGVESAAVPLITALVLDARQRKHDLRAFTIRPERKTYGKRNIIEGSPSELPVVFIDDLTSPQHNSFWHAMHAISSVGLKPYSHGYVLVLKQAASETRAIPTSMQRVFIESLFTLSDFDLNFDNYHEKRSHRGV
jgi:orotate phosphoribosyltransferase